MTEKIKFYYNANRIIPNYIAMICLSVFLVWSPYPSTYFSFLKHMPGIIVVYGCVAIFLYFLMLRLPTFVRSVLRIPALEFDGTCLIIRGWEDRSFNLDPTCEIARQIHVEVDNQNEVINVTSDEIKSARIYMRQVNDPRMIVSFLESLTSNG